MEINNFLMQDVVLGTKELGYMTETYLMKAFNYIETAISYDNDYRLGKILPKHAKIISTISSLSVYDSMLRYHLKWLKRGKIDILLVNAHGAWNNDDLLRLAADKMFYEELGLSGVESIDDVQKVLDLGIDVKWVSMTLNPTYFNLELITFLREHGIKIISHGILGGNIMAETNIEVYTLQFLLAFAALYSDLVCISGKNMEETNKIKLTLEKYKGLPVSEEEKAVYMFTSSRIVKRAPLKPLPLYRYLVTSGLVIKFKGPKDLYIPHISMDDDIEKLDLPEDEQLSKTELFIKTSLETLTLPEDCIPGSGEDEAYWRYTTIALLNSKPQSILYKNTYEKQGNVFLIIRKRRKLWKKITEVYTLVVGENGLPVFKQVADEME